MQQAQTQLMSATKWPKCKNKSDVYSCTMFFAYNAFVASVTSAALR